MTTAMKTGTESPELFVKHDDGTWHHNGRQVSVAVDHEHNTLSVEGTVYDIQAVEPYVVDEDSGCTDLDHYCVKKVPTDDQPTERIAYLRKQISERDKQNAADWDDIFRLQRMLLTSKHKQKIIGLINTPRAVMIRYRDSFDDKRLNGATGTVLKVDLISNLTTVDFGRLGLWSIPIEHLISVKDLSKGPWDDSDADA